MEGDGLAIVTGQAGVLHLGINIMTQSKINVTLDAAGSPSDASTPVLYRGLSSSDFHGVSERDSPSVLS